MERYFAQFVFIPNINIVSDESSMMELLRETPLESGPRVRGADHVAAAGNNTGRAKGRTRKAPTAKSIQKTFLSRDAPLFSEDEDADIQASGKGEISFAPGSLEPVPSAEPTQRESNAGPSEDTVPAVVAQSPDARPSQTPKAPESVEVPADDANVVASESGPQEPTDSPIEDPVQQPNASPTLS